MQIARVLKRLQSNFLRKIVFGVLIKLRACSHGDLLAPSLNAPEGKRRRCAEHRRQLGATTRRRPGD